MTEIELYSDDWAFMGDRYEQIVEFLRDELDEEPTPARVHEEVE